VSLWLKENEDIDKQEQQLFDTAQKLYQTQKTNQNEQEKK
jgi:hypothetical protein